MALIYCCTNKINGKLYIGQTNQLLHQRVAQHKYRAKKCNDYFYNALNKYGFDNFSFEVIEKDIDTQNNLDNAEIYWIEWYNTTNKKIGYNLTKGGKGKGKIKLSESHRHNISKSLLGNQRAKGMKHTEETKKKIGLKTASRKHSEETKKKMSKSQLGRKHSEETKKKISMTKRGLNVQ